MTRAIVAVAAAGLLTGAFSADKFDTKSASFALSFHDEVSAYRDAAMFVRPQARVVLTAIGGPAGDYAARTGDGTLVQIGARQWRWDAPEKPGLSTIVVNGPAERGGDTITLHAWVLVPATGIKDGLLNGYRVGAYPAKPLKGDPAYLPPGGFVEVTKENRLTKVSPHFTLEQFLCKEETSSRFPKYLVLKERLPLALEAILERVNQLGFHVETLHVMSAYRTPFYNHLIGDVLYSQHQWGSAADIFIDPSGTGRMDDLNADGKIDVGDSKWLYDEIAQLTSEPDTRKFEGGLGFYRGTASHPPFVHVDMRGVKARWQG